MSPPHPNSKRKTTVESISVGSIVAQVTYKPIRNLYLRVKSAHGPVELSAPLRASRKRLEQFLSKQESWIQRQQQRYLEQATALQCEAADGSLSYWGQRCRLERIAAQEIKIEAAGGLIRLYAPALITAEESRLWLEKWLREQLAGALSKLVVQWCRSIGVAVGRVTIRRMRSRWGSCNATRGSITINSELIHYPPACLEYVVVHELLHLLVPRHDRHFYALLDRYLPGWAEARRELARRPLRAPLP